MVTLTIDGYTVEVPAETTILEAARKAGIEVPTLCHHPDQSVKGVCRVCVVEVEGARTFAAACAQPVADGMVVRTNTPAVREARKVVVELMLATHPEDCLTCIRNQNCELQALAEQLGVRQVRFDKVRRGLPLDISSPSIVREPDKCINCRRCVETCHEVQSVGVLYPTNRGHKAVVDLPYDEDLLELACALCGQCIHACPVGAIRERDNVDDVWDAIADPNKHVVVQTAPAVRVTIGEEFGMEPGTVVTGKLAAALRRLGFDRAFDTDFSADLTIMEEGNEFIHRLSSGGTLPLITSCSPGWIKYIEHCYPDLIPHLSTCKSPQQMFGALAKTFYAEKEGIDPESIVVVSIMPCTAKKFEAQRPEMTDSGYPDVDIVLTTRELGRMIRESGVDWHRLPDEEYDNPLGISTGAAVIFGATGGVMEAALRTAYEVVTGETLAKIDFEEVRGMEGIKEAAIPVGDITVKVAVAHGLSNAKQLLDAIVAGEADFHFIEIMACPGGCIGGGGQPIPTTNEVRRKRIAGIYQADRDLPLRKSHENPAVIALYEEYLGKPLGEKSHKLLHTEYTKRKIYAD